jgi:hypothetical protein
MLQCLSPTNFPSASSNCRERGFFLIPLVTTTVTSGALGCIPLMRRSRKGVSTPESRLTQ